MKKALVRKDNKYVFDFYRAECIFTDGPDGVEIRIEEGCIPNIAPGVLADYDIIENVESILTPIWYEGDFPIIKYLNNSFVIVLP